MIDLIGKNIDGFQITSALGSGGMGVVYKAYDTKLDRYVAIKMLHPAPTQSYRHLMQLKKEAKHQARLSHPNIVVVHGLLEYHSLLGIVMEYIEGENLHEVTARRGKIELNQALQFIKQILLGIDYAHSKGFIHRDIKPSNIIVGKDGIVKIMDFGISKSLYDSGEIKTHESKIGTVYYMSPEQIRGEGSTVRSDIYSIGCTAYEILAGFPPFFFSNEYEVIQAHLNKLPAPLSSVAYGMPDWLDSIIMKMLEKNSDNRYHNCGTIYKEIYRKTTPVNYPDEPTPQPKQAGKGYKAIRFVIVVILLLILLAVSYYVVTTMKFQSTEEPKPDPNRQQPVEKFLR